MNNNIIYTSMAVCSQCKISKHALEELVKLGVAKPYAKRVDQWYFTHKDLSQIQLASKYLHYLKLEPSGAIVALELHNEIQRLKTKYK